MKNLIFFQILFFILTTLPSGHTQQYARISPTFTDFTTWHDLFGIGDEVTLVGYFNRDSRADIVAFTRGEAGDVYVAVSDGSSFRGTGMKWHDSFCYGSEVPLVGDFNGDGVDDIATFTRDETGDVFVALSDGSSFQGTGNKWHDSFCFGTEIPVTGDFNGDGKDDIAAFTRGQAGDVFVALSDGSSFQGTGMKWHDNFCFGNEIPLAGDFNVDGRDDIIVFTGDQAGDVYVAVSDGGSFQGTGDKWNDMFSVSGEIPVIPHRGGDRILTFNLANGDVWEARAEHQPGKAAFPPCPNPADCNRPNGFSQGVKVLTRFCITGQTPQAADFDGDGYFDLVCFLKSSYSASPQGDVNVAIRPVVIGKMD